MEMAVVFREGHCSLSGKIIRTIFHSIKLLHLAQLATHTKVKERDLILYDRELWCMCMKASKRQKENDHPQSGQSNNTVHCYTRVSIALLHLDQCLERVKFHIVSLQMGQISPGVCF